MTTKAKHTPGPWRGDHEAILSPDGDTICTIAGVDWPLLHPAEESSPWDRAQDANARLIAAAPELLAALRDVIHPLEHGDPDGYARRVRAARAAIAKAEGGES